MLRASDTTRPLASFLLAPSPHASSSSRTPPCSPPLPLPSSPQRIHMRRDSRSFSLTAASSEPSKSHIISSLKTVSPTMDNILNNTTKEELQLFELMAISSLDGRHARQVKKLKDYLSEYGLIRYRVLVEVQWLLKLSEIPEVEEVPLLSEDARLFLESISSNFSPADALAVKGVERVTNHDVKAVEYVLKDKCRSHPELEKVLEFIHFACTSEDINNLAHGLMLQHSVHTIVLPIMAELIESLRSLSHEYSDIATLSPTHGQPASPTALGKEMDNFYYRLEQQCLKISATKFRGKFAGAVGNYNAHVIAYPNVKWDVIAEAFVSSLGLDFNPFVTQIEPHDYIAELFDSISRFNNILLAFDRDICSYISIGYFKQRVKAGEVGSSTMPHKVNPIDFENSEGNLRRANTLSSHFSSKLPVSRWQRDLSDSTVLRNLGSAVAYSVIAYESILRGIGKLQVDQTRIKNDLFGTWEVLAEPIQTVMRKYGVPEPYEKLKALTRGNTIGKEDLQQFIGSLDIPSDVKHELLQLTPETYIGLAAELAKSI